MAKRESKGISKELTSLIVDYKKTGNQINLVRAARLCEGLIGSVYKYYGMLQFPPSILEDLTLDCQSVILIKAIEMFDPSRNTEFSTFYTWRIKSHIRAKKGYYMRRGHLLLQTLSLDAPPGSYKYTGLTLRNLHETIGNPKHSYRELGIFKRAMSDLFDLT